MKYIPVDIETTGLSFIRDHILGVGYRDQYCTATSYSVPGPLTAHNFKFEYKFFKRASISANIEFDTLLAAAILIDRPEALKLDALAYHYLGWESWKSDTDKLFKKKNWVELYKASPELQKALAERNIFDLKSTGALTEVLTKKLSYEGMETFYFEKLMPAAKLLADVEYRGMRIDVDATRQKMADISQKIAELKKELDMWAAPSEINWNSPKQLTTLLKQKGYNLWIYDFKKKQQVESTGVDSLERLLPNPNIAKLLEYRQTTKLLGYLEGWLEDHDDSYLHPSYNVASTRTGRLSCSAPNLQQVPRDKTIRSLFIPDEGKKFVIADYAQIEPRIAAHYSGDEALLNVFRENLDFYGSIATRVLGVKCHPNEVKEKFPKERRVAKEIGLSILYGIGAGKLSSIIRKRTGLIFSKDDCTEIIADYFAAYPGLLKLRRNLETRILKGETIKNHYGRQFKIDQSKIFSTAVNTLIQSSASDACLFSQLEVERRLRAANIEAPLIALVHDEVIRQCNSEHAEIVGKIMEEVMTNQGFNCPLKLDWAPGNNWGDKT